MDHSTYLGLDIGARRIGVATGDSIGRLAAPLPTVLVDGSEVDALATICREHQVTDIVLGLPRDQSGQPTEQTAFAQAFGARLKQVVDLPQHWQDESLTSVLAEQRLQQRKKTYSKEAIDAEAACIILQDYLDGLV